jgi:acetyl esterase
MHQHYGRLRRLVVLVIALAVALPAFAQDTSTPQPNAQMKAVLDQLAALGGKPIETLSAEDARQQPTPTDAVKAC